MEIDVALSLLAIAGLLLAGIVKGATGLGYASCALPFLVLAFGLKSAMAIIVIPAMATNISVVLLAGNIQETLTRFQWLYVAIFPGVALGVLLLQWVSQPAAVKLLGVVLILYVGLALARPEINLPTSLHQALQIPTGLLNGVITGMTGAQVMPLFPYVMALNLDPARTVQVVNIAVLISTFFLGIGLYISGIMTPRLLLLSSAATIPAVLGSIVGNRIRAHIPAVQFRRIVLATLLLVGVLMLFR
jgi:uncharacterized protein